MSTAELESKSVTDPSSPDISAYTPVAPLPPPSHWWMRIIALVLVAGGIFAVVKLVRASKSSGPADSTKARLAHDLPVVTATARIGDLNSYLIGLGTVTPLNTVTVKSRVDGAIDKIAFTEGQMVKAGNLLFQIDPRPYDAALKQAMGQLAKDQATKDNTDWAVNQDNEALKTHAIAVQQLHTDTAARDQATGAIEIDQAAIDTAKLNLEYARITAPIPGRIGLRLVDVGNIIHSSDTNGLAVITQLQPITVVFNLPEDNIAIIQRRIAGGKPVTIDAYDRDLKQKLAIGKLLAIDNQIDPNTGTVKIKALFDNQDNALFPSQFVNARMLIDTITNAVLVPSAAVQHSPTSTFVYLFKRDGTMAGNSPASTAREVADAAVGGSVTMREITVGPTQAAIGPDEEDTTAILNGLQKGDIVVTDGVDKLLEGTKVIAHPAELVGKRRSATGPAAVPGGPTTRRSHGGRPLVAQ